MKLTKRILSICLVVALICLLFASCKSGEPKATTEPTPTNTPAATTPDENEEKTPEPVAEPENPQNETYSPEDYTDLVMYYFDLRMVGADHGQHIEDALNEYLGPKYGLQLDVTWFTIGDWLTKIQLNISGGERIDVLPLCANSNVQILHTNNMIQDITDLMAEYAPETVELMKDYTPCYEYGGRLFGVPTYRGYVKNSYIVMRKDILDELGMTEQAKNLDNLDDFEKILAAVHDNYTAETGMYAVAKEAGKSVMPGGLWNGPKFADITSYESLGDSTSQVMVLKDDQVEWLLDDPRFEEKLQMVRRWRENGWVYPDCALIDTHGDELMKQGVSFSEFTGSEYGVEAVKGGNCGHEVVCPMYILGRVDTDNLLGWGVGVPVTAEEPEAACRMINVLYTDEYVMNLITRGQEGVDYTVKDGEIIYPEEGHYYEADFILGNNVLLLPLEGQGADYFEEIQAINEAAPVSKYLGFLLDTGDLSNIIANLTAVRDQYSSDLSCGNYTPESFANYKAALESAGVHDYLSAVQEQLNAWLAAR